MLSIMWYAILKALSSERPEFFPVYFQKSDWRVENYEKFHAIDWAFLDCITEMYHEKAFPFATICAIIRATVCHPEFVEFIAQFCEIPLCDGGAKECDLNATIWGFIEDIALNSADEFQKEILEYDSTYSPARSMYLLYAYRSRTWLEQTEWFYKEDA